MDFAQQKKEFFSQLAPEDQILRLLDHLSDVTFFVKDAEGLFMAHSLNKFQDRDVEIEEDVFGKTDHDFYTASRANAYRADDVAVMNSCIPMVNRLEPAPEPLGSPRLVTTLGTRMGRSLEWRVSQGLSNGWTLGRKWLAALLR
jgi:hypothetical protein